LLTRDSWLVFTCIVKRVESISIKFNVSSVFSPILRRRVKGSIPCVWGYWPVMHYLDLLTYINYNTCFLGDFITWFEVCAFLPSLKIDLLFLISEVFWSFIFSCFFKFIYLLDGLIVWLVFGTFDWNIELYEFFVCLRLLRSFWLFSL